MFYLLIGLLVVIGCEEKNDSKALNSSISYGAGTAFLTAADIAAPVSIASLDENLMTERLNSESAFTNYSKNDSSSNTENTSESGKCIDKIYDAIALKPTDTTLKIDVELDFLECANKGENEKDVYEKYTQRIYLEVQCGGGGLGNLKTFSDLSGNEDACKNKVTAVLSNWKVEFKFSGTISGSDYSGEGAIISYSGGSDLDAATTSFSGDVATIGDSRIDVSINQATSTIGGISTVTNDYVRVEYRGVSGGITSSDTYFATGNFGVTVNNWTGTVTNQAADKAPTYVLKSDAGVESSGTINPSLGSSLRLIYEGLKIHPKMKTPENLK